MRLREWIAKTEFPKTEFPLCPKKFKCHLFKWKEATTGSFCIVSCFVLSWWELHLLHLGSISCMYDVQTFQNSRTPRNNCIVTHLILDMEPRCSAWVNLFRQKSKEIVEPSAIAGRSSEMSQKGSIVVDTPLHTCVFLQYDTYMNVFVLHTCEKVYDMMHTGMFFVANLTHNIWLEFPCEYCVNDAGAGGGNNACSNIVKNLQF